MSSPNKKRLHDEDPEAEAPAAKRQKVDAEGKSKKVIEDGSSDEFDPEGQNGSDSFDDDFL